jgi:hypothetical protein
VSHADFIVIYEPARPKVDDLLQILTLQSYPYRDVKKMLGQMSNWRALAVRLWVDAELATHFIE